MESRSRERGSAVDGADTNIRRRSLAPTASKAYCEGDMQAEQLNKSKRRGAYADTRDSDSGSDSEEHDGFVKVDVWKAPSEPLLTAFKPTIPASNIPVLSAASSPAAASITKSMRPAPRVRGSLIASAAPLSPKPAASLVTPSSSANTDAKPAKDYGPADSESDSSGSDEEISDVLDETEIQLIEAMEDTRITNAKNKEAAGATQQATASAGGSCSIPLRWVGIRQTSPGARSSFTDSLKERFSTPPRTGGTSISVTHGSSADPCVDSDDSGEDNEVTVTPPILTSSPAPALRSESSSGSSKKRVLETDSESQPIVATISDITPVLGSSPKGSSSGVNSPEGSSPEGSTPQNGDSEFSRSSSVPLDTVEFVAPGVAKETAMSLLRRVLDIDGPVIQQKMVEFLLIDGVIASLIGFITHCQGSVYSPARNTQTAPCSPSATAEGRTGHPASPVQESDHVKASDLQLQIGALQEFEQRQQHRERLRRQRMRLGGLSDADLRRGFNAVQMLTSRDQFARRVVEAKLSVIVPSLMAVFHADSLGSFHHACVLLEHCFTVSALKTTRLLLYQQNPASRWWWHSTAVARGHAPICDLVPYLSEPCVQRLFLKAEFGVWTGRLMISLNLMPNDAIVVADELSRVGLGSVASALGDDVAGAAQSQQRTKAMQLVRNRFQQLNRGGFLGQILELIEDSDPDIADSVGEFISSMINDCAAFVGFNILFKPMYDSELPVRRLAQLIINSPAQRLTVQAQAAVRLLHALLAKTSCQYGLRTREAQGIRDYELHPRGSQVLLHVGHAARSALESFLPGLLATVTGQQENTDLTSHSAFARRASVESLQLPEYDEADPDLDADATEAETSSDDDELELGQAELVFGDIGAEDSGSESSSGSDSNADGELRGSAAALLQATYPASLGSGTISSSLSPSSTLSASPVAVASTTPEPVRLGAARLDAEDLGMLVELPKPDAARLNLLRLCIEVLREAEDVDEIIGWVDLRVWRALSTWFLNHPHNNILHMAVYQLVSAVVLEAVRRRHVQRQQHGSSRAMTIPRAATLGKASSSLSGEASDYFSAEAHSLGPGEPVGKPTHRAQRRRALADRMRRDEASNCDNVLTYLVEQHQWIEKLVRRATSPNFDGAHGYISLILNTLRLAVQVDRRRSVVADGQSDAEKHAESDGNAEDAEKQDTLDKHGNCTDSEDRLEKHESELEEAAMLPDLAYHDPATRARLAEYPLYRLQRWEISLLYSPAFRSHLRQLRRQAWLMARKATEFRLYDQTRSEAEAPAQQRPVPHFSPQRVRAPQMLENTEIKKKQLQINVDLLLGSSSAAAVGVTARAAERGPTETLDEVGVDVDSLFARMLGFTEDLTERPVAARGGKANDGTRRSNKMRRAEFGRGARRKKTRSGAALLLDELGTESAEAIMALAGSSALAGSARHVPPPRSRKKAATASGSVRRRRARLNHRSSSSNLNASDSSALTGSLQSLDLEQ
ncbi:hypothetical protein LPJ76_002058 [Coemansia sp. RSA 638]|nr:hypothetical protein LPJ76_002058 [Coemansia sp. RSA 638]